MKLGNKNQNNQLKGDKKVRRNVAAGKKNTDLDVIQIINYIQNCCCLLLQQLDPKGDSERVVILQGWGCCHMGDCSNSVGAITHRKVIAEFRQKATINASFSRSANKP